MLVSYTVESKKPFKEKPSISDPKGSIIADNNEGYAEWNNEYGEFKDKDHKVYSGALTYTLDKGSFDVNKLNSSKKKEMLKSHQIDASNIPDKMTLALDIDTLGGMKEDSLHGHWNFKLNIESEKAKGNIKEIEVNHLSSLYPNTKLEKVIITPIETYLQGTLTDKNGYFDYIVANDKNETLKWTGGSVLTVDQDARLISYYEGIKKDTTSLTVIPYKTDKTDAGYPAKAGVPLNLKGETKVPLDANKNLTITRVEEKAGKTYIYYETKVPINEYLPFGLVDSQGINT